MVSKNSFPFEKITPVGVKIRSIPIELNWPENGGRMLPGRNSAAGKKSEIREGAGMEPPGQRRWFRSPPKVQIVAGILGVGPNCGTHGGDIDRGEREVDGDSESEHRKPSSPPFLRSRQSNPIRPQSLTLTHKH